MKDGDHMPDDIDPEENIIIRDPSWTIAYLCRKTDAMKAEMEELQAEFAKVKRVKIVIDLTAIITVFSASAWFWHWISG